jgi:hypothetical protein
MVHKYKDEVAMQKGVVVSCDTLRQLLHGIPQASQYNCQDDYLAME